MVELREISPEQLKEILEDHRKWVDSNGTEGRHAELKETDLRHLDLSGVNLSKADLRNANLERTDLHQANLIEANLTDADLGGANLKGADLSGAVLTNAHLDTTILKETRLVEAKLRGADLSYADLSGAILYKADIREATVRKADLRNASLDDSDLTGVKGLLAGQLAGANVSGATLPPDIHKFEALTTINEASKNTKRIFLAMLLACAYSALTVFSTADARLLTNSASSPLPIIGTAIPIAGFFGVAPGILFAIFLYFHFYLQRLWHLLSNLPAIFPDGTSLDDKVYPWLLNGLVRSHVVLLSSDRPPLSRLQNFVSILLAWWTVPFTIVLFWLRYLPRHDWLGTGFHLVFLIVAVVCTFWFQRLAKRTLRGQQPEPIVFKGNWRNLKPYWEVVKRTWKLGVSGAIITFFAIVISDGAINGTKPEQGKKTPAEQEDAKFRRVLILHREIIPMILPYFGARAFADLKEQDVSTKPSNWFLGNKELTQIVSGAQLRGRDLHHATASGAFLVKADLREAHLQSANLSEANLQGANLYKADLQGANLVGANLKEANLVYANLQKARLDGANLQGANLVWANLKGAHLGDNIFVGDYEIKGLTVSNVTDAENWDLAFYPADFLEVLGLQPDHNNTLPNKLAELAKRKNAAVTKK